MPTPSDRCEDICYAIRAILVDVNGHTEQAFLATESLRAACYYRFIIVGEAAQSLLASCAVLIAQCTPNLTQSLSHAHRLRTLLAHHYHRVDAKIVWDTIQNDIPQLSADVNALRAVLP